MIINDIIESATLRRDSEGFEADRTFIISDVKGSAEAKLYNAMTMAGIPQYGDPHPSIPDIQVTDIIAMPLKSGEKIKISVTYSIPGEDDAAGDDQSGKLVITSALTNEQTHFDIDGNLISVRYFDGTTTGINITYSPIEVQRPQMRASFTRKEQSLPKDNIREFLGKINSIEWSGYPAETWLCSGIDVRENEGFFEVDYSFEFREEKWLGEVVIPLNSLTASESPIDKASGNGYGLFNVYRTANFNKLGLSF